MLAIQVEYSQDEGVSLNPVPLEEHKDAFKAAEQKPLTSAEPAIEAPQSVESSSKGLQVVFDSNGQEQTITFMNKPVGLSFNPGLPLVIKSVSNAALKQGVQAGWMVKSFDDINMSDSGMTYDKATQLMKQRMVNLPGEALQIVFEANGKEQVVSFSQKPLGLAFQEGLPLTVKTANRQDVQQGWVVKSVNDLNISESMTHDQVVQHLQAIAQNLPLNESFKALQIVFESDGKECPISFKQKPLGLTFCPGLNPPIVESVSDSAKILGVQPGWEVKSINGMDVATLTSSGPSQLVQFLQHYTQHLESNEIDGKVAGS